MSKRKGFGRAVAALSVIALTSLILAGCDPPPQPVRREGVLRVLSWNTFNLPTIAGEMGQVNLDEEDRGRLVARLLKRSGYEVIALNEVFDETVRDALIEEAESGSDAFRFVVEDLDGGGLEDSGLVLLSRLEPIRFDAPAPVPGQHGGIPPFIGAGFTEPFSGTAAYHDTRHCAHMDVWWKGHGDDGEVDAWVGDAGANCLIAFHRYRACTDETPDDSPFGAECEAGKGVGYVRLQQQNGAPLDVFWSHTQATLRAPEYELPLPDFATERREQLEELAAMVEHWSPADERDSLIMGDLNVDGLKAPDAPQEYGKLLAEGPGSLLGRMGFRDLWPEAAPREDAGASYAHRNDHVGTELPEERLDYLLWRDRNGGDICDQHPRVERHFDAHRPSGATVDLSDHYGVGGELRRRARDTGGDEPCSPSLARPLEALLPSAEMAGTLAVPGACHWLRIEQGTWTVVNLTAPPLSLSAYAASDISEPLDFFRGDTELESLRKAGDEAQVAVDEPFLLKICWQDPSRTGAYRIKVAPNVGADPAHPVVLTLNRNERLGFGQQFGVNPGTLLWTLVRLPKTFSGDPHALQAELGGHSSTGLRVGTAPVGSASPPITWIGGFSTGAGIQAAGSFGGAGAQELHLVVERKPPDDPTAAVSFRARAITDHHEVGLQVLECREQEDATGDDRVRMTYAADGKTLEIVDLGDFDEGQDVNLSGHSTLGLNWVKGPVAITVYDQDGEDLEDDVTSGNALDNLGTVVIDDMGGLPPPQGESIDGSGTFTQDEADYRLDHRRRR